MTDPTTISTGGHAPPATDSGGEKRASRWARLWEASQLIVSLGIALLTLLLLMWPPAWFSQPHNEDSATPKPKEEIATITDQGWIRVLPGSTLENKLEVATVRLESVTTPLMTAKRVMRM